jgi:hypothetical protein
LELEGTSGTDVELPEGDCGSSDVEFAATGGTVVILLVGDGGALVRVESVVISVLGNSGVLVRDTVVSLPLGSDGALVRMDFVVILVLGTGGVLVKDPVVLLLGTGGALVRVESVVILVLGSGGVLVKDVESGGRLVRVESVVILVLGTGGVLVCVEFVVVAGGKVEDSLNPLDEGLDGRMDEVLETLPGKVVLTTAVELLDSDGGSVGKGDVLLDWLTLTDGTDVDNSLLV